MAELPSLTMEDLYAVLGFYKGHPTRSKDALHDELKHFYNNYIAAGNSHFPYTNTNTRSEPALQCARGFLLEDNRGERLWPITSDEVVEWHTDREYIEEVVGNLFRRKAISSKCVAIQNETRQRKAAGLPTGRARKQNTKTPSAKATGKRKRKHTPRQERDACDAILQPTTMKEWNKPPSEPNTKVCIEYIRSLNPKHDGESRGFTVEWLVREEATWPANENPRLERFMHDNDFYLLINGKEETPSTIRFANTIRQGTELEGIESIDCRTFLRRMGEAIRDLTLQLSRPPTFILECRRDATVHKTDKFERLWERNEEYWSAQLSMSEFSDDNRLKPLKRRKSKVQDYKLTYAPCHVSSRLQSRGSTPSPDLMSTAANALEMSRNMLTVHDLEEVPPGMNERTDVTSIEHAMSHMAQDVMLSDRPNYPASSLSSNDSISIDTAWWNEMSATSLDVSPSRELLDGSNDEQLPEQCSPKLRSQPVGRAPAKESSLVDSHVKAKALPKVQVKSEPTISSSTLISKIPIGTPGSGTNMPIDLTDDDDERFHVPGEQDDSDDGAGLANASAYVDNIAQSWSEDRHSRHLKSSIPTSVPLDHQDRTGPKKTPQRESPTHVASPVSISPAVSSYMSVQDIDPACQTDRDHWSKTPPAPTNHNIPATSPVTTNHHAKQPSIGVHRSLAQQLDRHSKDPTEDKGSTPQILPSHTTLLTDLPKGSWKSTRPLSQTSSSVLSPGNTKSNNANILFDSESMKQRQEKINEEYARTLGVTEGLADSAARATGKSDELAVTTDVETAQINLDRKNLEPRNPRLPTIDKAKANPARKDTYKLNLLKLKAKMSADSSSSTPSRGVSSTSPRCTSASALDFSPAIQCGSPTSVADAVVEGDFSAPNCTWSESTSSPAREPLSVSSPAPTPQTNTFTAINKTRPSIPSQLSTNDIDTCTKEPLPAKTLTWKSPTVPSKSHSSPSQQSPPIPCLKSSTTLSGSMRKSNTPPSARSSLQFEPSVKNTSPPSAATPRQFDPFYNSIRKLCDLSAFLPTPEHTSSVRTKSSESLGNPVYNHSSASTIHSSFKSPQSPAKESPPAPTVASELSTAVSSPVNNSQSPAPEQRPPESPIWLTIPSDVNDHSQPPTTSIIDSSNTTPERVKTVSEPEPTNCKTTADSASTQAPLFPLPVDADQASGPSMPSVMQALPDSHLPKVNGSYAMVSPSAPFSMKPSPSEVITFPTTKPNLERSLFKPITDRDPNVKTLELVIMKEDGSLDMENAFPFQYAQDNKLTEFFDFSSTVSGVPLCKFKELQLSCVFGKDQVFKFERLGDARKNEQSWKSAKKMITHLFKLAQKEDPEEYKFQVLVMME